jgi:hypothetical protein
VQLQPVHHPVKRCLQPRKIFVWRYEQQIEILPVSVGQNNQPHALAKLPAAIYNG